MGQTDYENKIFNWLIESHQKGGLVDLEKVERYLKKLGPTFPNIQIHLKMVASWDFHS